MTWLFIFVCLAAVLEHARPQYHTVDAFSAVYLNRRYAILFYTLLLTMAAAPLIAVLRLTGSLLDLFFAVSLVAAVMPAGTSKERTTLLIAVAVVWLARSASAWLDQPTLSAATLVISTAIGLFAAAGALSFTMRAKRIDSEHIYAALSAYLLSGIFFSLLYWALEQLGPGSFATAGEFSRMSAIYFSFVTLATLGYGDIVPRTDVARGLVVVEAVGGQLFLAVLVARLVSLYARFEPPG